ncbi:MAG: membrane protein insertase YidC [Bacteroidetes bacterium]|nr:membrane protein insertase YidC [Bacteroidota bacterium]
MDRNSLIGWTLMGLLMVAMMYVMQQQRAKNPQETEVVSQQDSVRTAPTTETEVETEDRLPVIEAEITQGKDHPIADSAKQVEVARKFGAFGNHLNGTEEELVVENDVLAVTFSNKGGFPKTVELKEYKTWDQQPLLVYSVDKGEFDITFSAYLEDGQTAGFHTSDLYFEPIVTKNEDGATRVQYRIKAGDGKYYEHEYIVPSSGYLVDFNLNTKNFDDVIYSRKDFFELNWEQRMESLENNIQTERMYSSLYYADGDYGTDKIGPRKSAQKDADYSIKWVSFKQKFFSSVLMTKESFARGSKFGVTIPDHKDYVKDVTANLTMDYIDGETFSFPMQFYYGPNKYKTLKEMDVNLQKSLQLGASVIRWVNLGIIIPMFNFLNRFINNYGLIIFLLTIFIKLIVTPFTYKSYLSMIKMRVLQPELTELRAKFGKDQQKMGAAQMDLYRKAGVNPLGGCLPMLFQFPILIAMYRFFPASIELRQESFLWATDLSTFDSIYSWTAEVPLLSQVYGNHISLFTILMAITSFFYTRMNSQNTPTDPSNPMAAQMKTFQYIMPFMLIFIFNKFSAALSYYYFLFNVVSVAQQWFMKRYFINEDKVHAQIQENKKKVKTKSKWQTRMEDMMKKQQDTKNQKGKR